MDIVGRVIAEHQVISAPALSDILEADRWARDKAGEMV